MNNPKLKIFSILFGAVYTASFYWDLALFRYFPEVGEFHWRFTPDAGPAILWYGWLATSALASGAVALLTPRSVAERLSPAAVWAIPVLTVVVILIYESRWFV